MKPKRGFSLLFFLTIISYSQQNDLKYFEFTKEPLDKVLFAVERAYDVRFSYLDEVVQDKDCTIKKGSYTLLQIITNLTNSTGLVFKRINQRYFAVYQEEYNTNFLIDSKVLKEVIIHAYLTEGIFKNRDNSFSIVPKKLGVIPGLTEPDVLQTLQRLPGVIGPNETVTGIHVRGGTPDQNSILWDGIPIYHNGHLFGMISGFNPNIKQTIHFYNKGNNPIFGGRISSIISIETNDKIPDKAEVSLGFNAINADVNANIPVVKDKLKIQIAGRHSYTDLYQSYTFNRLSQKVFQNTKIAEEDNKNKFYFQDYNAKILYKISKKSDLTFSGIYIGNVLNNKYQEEDSQSTFNDVVNIENKGYSAKWNKKWTTYFSNSISAFYSDYSFDYDYLTIHEEEDVFEIFVKKNKVLDSGLKLDTNYTINDNISLNSGYQLLAQDVSHAFIIKTPSLKLVLDSRSTFIQTHSLYSSLNITTDNIITLNGGVRLSYITGLEKFVFEPRLNFNYKINEELQTSFTAEVKNQIISQINETVISGLGLENQLWVLSDMRRFPILKGTQLTAGLSYNKNRWTIDIDTYLKQANGLTTLTFGFLNSVDPDFHIGKSRSYGVDFYIKKSFSNIKTWLTYSYNTTQNKFEGLNSESYFPFNSEIKHTINTAISYKIKNWQFATGWYWHTGKPYTLISNVNKQTISSLVYEKLNGERLPNYHRLDISAVLNFEVSKRKNIHGKLGLSLYNIYNQKNILNREYYTHTIYEDELHVRDRYSLSFTPNIFCRIKF